MRGFHLGKRLLSVGYGGNYELFACLNMRLTGSIEAEVFPHNFGGICDTTLGCTDGDYFMSLSLQ